MRNVYVKRDGKTLQFMLNDQALRVKWDTETIFKGMASGMLYPKIVEQLFKVLHDRLEDCTPTLTAEEIKFLIAAAKRELEIK